MKSIRLIAISTLAVALLQCRRPNPPETGPPPSRPLILFSPDGDTIPTGVPFTLEGTTSAITPPTVFPAGARRIPAGKPGSYPVHKLKTVPFPRDLPKTTPGENGIPLPRVLPAKEHPIAVTISPPTPAAPFAARPKTSGEFRNLDVAQGLASSFILGLVEDRRGQIWIGSMEGLIRYDGGSFRQFRSEQANLHKVISCMLEDRAGQLWFGQYFGQGLTRYDGRQFRHYGVEEGLDAWNLNSLLEDRKGRLWIGTSNTGLICFDGTQFTYYTTAQGLQDNYVGGILEDAQGAIWAGHTDGYSRFDGRSFSTLTALGLPAAQVIWPSKETGSGKLWLGAGGQVIAYTGDSLEYYGSPALDRNFYSVLFATRDGQRWAGTRGGALRMDGQAATVYTEADGLSGINDYPHLEDRYGRIWFSSQGNGVYRYNPQAFRQVLVEPTFGTMPVASMLEDRNGRIWLGSHFNGVARYDGESFTVFPDMNRWMTVARSLLEDRAGNIWIGSPTRGLFKYDGTAFTGFDRGQVPGAREMYALTKDSGQVQEAREIYALAEDRSGAIWIGHAGGLDRMDGGRLTAFRLRKAGNTAEKTGWVRTLLTDRNGTVWAGLQNGGLWKYDGQQFTVFSTREGLSSNRVVSLFEDSKGRLWIGTDDSGVNCYDGKIFTRYSVREGLSSNAVWTISEDRTGNIWLGAGTCLNVLPVNRDSTAGPGVVEYCDLDGVTGAEFYANASLRDRQGRLWWGHNKSLTMAQPENVLPPQQVPKIQLNDVVINQQFVDFRRLADTIAAGKAWWTGRDRPQNLAEARFDSLMPFFNYPLGLELPHGLNSLSFQFTADDCPESQKLRYSFKLEGLDRDWSGASPESRVDYRSLPPGTYTLLARAAGPAQRWSEPFSYTFHIRPPWWASWWAQTLYVLTFILLVYRARQFELKRRLERAKAEHLEQLDQLKTRLYTNISHEFRTPLSVIMGMAENIKGHEQEKTLIRRNSRNLLQLINQMLDLSKLESGQLKLNNIQADVVGYLQYLTESFYSMANEKGIRLTYYPEVDTLVMDYDPEKLQHILYNLLSNAIRFTPADSGGKVILHLARTERDGAPQLQLKVKDTGIGIAPEKLAHIFERFYQADDSPTRREGGTGIGLALTRELVGLMGGEIRVQSTPGKGTEFSVRLPIRHEAVLGDPVLPDGGPGVEAHIAEDGEDAAAVGPDERPLLLIVEDNHDLVQYMQSLLKEEYRIQVARDGEAGIELALELIPDIVISDLMMPKKDGYELCRTLKTDERTSHIPIILLTAKAAREDRIQGLKHGADAFLTKPFDREELQVQLEKLVELRRQLQKRYAAAAGNGTPAGPAASLEDVFLEKLRAAVEAKLDDADFSPTQLAKAVLLSPMQVYRKLQALTGQTPSKFIRSVRLRKGLELLRGSELTIAEIAYETGFTDPNYFSRVFHEEFGRSPSEFRKRS